MQSLTNKHIYSTQCFGVIKNNELDVQIYIKNITPKQQITINHFKLTYYFKVY